MFDLKRDTKLILINILQYFLIILIILECNSVFSQIYGKHYYIRSGMILFVGFIMILLIFLKNNSYKIILNKPILLIILYDLLCSLLLLINCDNKNGIIIILLYFCFLFPIILIYLSQLSKDDIIVLLKKFVIIVFILSLFSIFLWYLCSVKTIIKPINQIKVVWAKPYSLMDNFYYIYFYAKNDVYWLTGKALPRNIGIFAEAPMYAAVLVLAMTACMYLYLNENSKKNQIIYISLIIILFLTTITTVSVTGIVLGLIILVFGLKKFYYNLNKFFKTIFIVATISIFIISIPIIYGILSKKLDSLSALNRSKDIKNGFKIFLTSPIIGKGINHARPFEDNPTIGYGYSNVIIPILTDGGIIFALIYIMPIIILLIEDIKSKKINNLLFVIIFCCIIFTTAIQYRILLLFFIAILYYKGLVGYSNKSSDLKYIYSKLLLNKYFEEKKNYCMDNDVLKKVCIVVVTYNRKELLKESIIALKNQEYTNYNILIIDNASTDGTEEYISEYLDDRTLYFNTGKNLGGAGGFNYGMKKAVQIGCDYIWIMDDDCIVNKDSLLKLTEYADSIDNNFGFLSSKVLWTDGTPCKMNIQRVNLSQEINLNDNIQKIRLASFVSLFMTTKTIFEMGLPIKDFFIWGDDWEFTYRISEKYDCFYLPSSVVTHKCKNNMGVNIVGDTSDRLDRYYYAYRNEGYFYRKTGLKGKIYFFLKKFLHFNKILLSKSKNKKQKLSIMKSGVRDSKKFNPKIEYLYDENNKLKVLEFFGEPLAYGGQEAFMINMYKNFSSKEISYTLCTPFDLTNKTLIELAEKRNENIVHYDYNFNSKFRKIYVKKAIKKILTEQKFDVIHIQSGSIFTLLNVAKIAKKYGVKKVIVHSHSTGNNNFKYRLIKKMSDKKIEKYADEFFACSKLAGEWKFPKSVTESDKFFVIKNGIDTKRFNFDESIREKYRNTFKLGDKFTILHVGRFDEMKNHKFIVEIAEKLRKNDVSYKFILVGEGQLKEEIVSKINYLGLGNYFIFLEKRNDIAELMMASDVFILPSLFEGLGIVAIEAQSSGLKTLCSDKVPTEANISNLCEFLELDSNKWIEKIVSEKNNTINRSIYSNITRDAGYDAKYSATILEKEYLD